MRRPQITAACAIFFTVALAVTWATSRPLSDLYLALAGGREAATGGLGKPDTWSFLTQGRVWINQSWGSDLLIYWIDRGAGETGLLVLKGALLLGIAAGVIALARRRGAGPGASVLAGGLAIAAAPQDLMLRPSLLTFLFVPPLFLVLERARTNLRWLAAAVLLLLIWANMHGGFLFGLAAFALWAGVRFIELRRHSPGSRSPSLLLAAVAASVFLAAFANPFGPRNLTLPFTLSSDVYRQVTEWQPLFTPEAYGFWIPWVFLVIVLLSAGAGAIRWARSGARFAAFGLVEAALAVVVLVMAVQSKRFVPLAAVVLAPRAALEIDRLAGNGRMLVAVALLLALATGFEHRGLLRFYDPRNPFRPPETLLERMSQTGTEFPVGGAAFLNANDVAGRIFQEWRWEGYLRWTCPRLSLSTGGRSQQVYTPADKLLRREILLDADPGARLRSLGVGLTAVPLQAEYAPFVQRLLTRKEDPWAYVYVDRNSAILADPGEPEGERLVRGAAAGSLIYPDPAVSLLSRGMCLASPAVGAPPDSAYRVLEQAVRGMPADFAYPLLVQKGQAAGVPREDLLRFLTGELERLAALPVHAPGAAAVEECRERVAGLVFGLASPGDDEARNLASSALNDAERTLDALARRYAHGPWAIRTAVRTEL